MTSLAHDPRSSRLLLRRARRAALRGVTLIEVLIVVAILSLSAAGVTVAVLPKFQEAQVKTTETNAREIRNAIQRWRGLKGGTDCPTISQLVQDKEIDSASKVDDAWGSPFKIQCTEDDVIIMSAGPDKKEGTKDDIIVPKGAKGASLPRIATWQHGGMRCQPVAPPARLRQVGERAHAPASDPGAFSAAGRARPLARRLRCSQVAASAHPAWLLLVSSSASGLSGSSPVLRARAPGVWRGASRSSSCWSSSCSPRS